MRPSASVLLPTRQRRAYLDVALRSVAGQVREQGAELIVVEDDPADPATAALVAAAGGRYLALGATRGLNAARNAAVAAASAAVVNGSSGSARTAAPARSPRSMASRTRRSRSATSCGSASSTARQRVPASVARPSTHPVRIPMLFFETYWDTGIFKDLWPTDGSQPLVLSMGDP